MGVVVNFRYGNSQISLTGQEISEGRCKIYDTGGQSVKIIGAEGGKCGIT
jgi:hypothetical protein